MTGWLYILSSAICSVIIAHLLKTAEFKKLNTVRVLTVNYITAAAIAFLTPTYDAGLDFKFTDASGALILAVIVGFIFIVNFFIYSKSVDKNGVGISVAAMRVSLIVPVLLSTFWYLEMISGLQWFGVFTVFIALYLLLPNKRKMLKEPLSAAWLLVLIFIGTGLGDASLKVFEEDFLSVITKEQFMGTVFISSFLIGTTVILFQKNWQFSKAEIVLGVAVGIPNLYSAIFLINALELLSGAIVYSMVNILAVLGATLVGIFRWGDRLTKAQWTGIVVTLISILLLI